MSLCPILVKVISPGGPFFRFTTSFQWDSRLMWVRIQKSFRPNKQLKNYSTQFHLNICHFFVYEVKGHLYFDIRILRYNTCTTLLISNTINKEQMGGLWLCFSSSGQILSRWPKSIKLWELCRCYVLPGWTCVWNICLWSFSVSTFQIWSSSQAQCF